MAGTPAQNGNSAAGNSDFSRKTMDLAEGIWAGPMACARSHDPREVDHGIQLANQASTWKAPKASDGEKGGPNMRGSRGDLHLPSQAAQWPGPSAGNFNDGEDLASFDARKADLKEKGINGNGMGDSLAIAAARTTKSVWPGPQASEVQQGYQRRPDGMASQQNQQSLTTIAVDCSFLPPSSPAPTTLPDGAPCSTAPPNTSPRSVKRKLNPIFVEALMRWPTGLSGFERQETAWTRWWLLMPSLLSQLVSSVPAATDMFGDAA